MAKDKDKEKSVEIMSPEPRAYIPPPSLLHSLEMHDRLAATDIANHWRDQAVKKAEEKAKEKDKEKHSKAGSKILLTLLLWLVLSPIIFAFEWAVVTRIYHSIFK